MKKISISTGLILAALLSAQNAFAAGEDACPFCTAVVEYPSCSPANTTALTNRAAQVYLGTARGNSMYDAMIAGSIKEGVASAINGSGIVNCMRDAIKAAGVTKGRVVYAIPIQQKNYTMGTTTSPLTTSIATKTVQGEILVR